MTVYGSADGAVCQQGTDLEILKQSSRLVHYCATPLLFDPVFRKQIQEEQVVQPPVKVFVDVFHSLFSLIETYLITLQQGWASI